ncbi:MAG: CPBP family intramembrane glutamic endopeptidase [Lachnospiraceae bacterium]|nr:CPBP family intramembrane glutamic endopeptidase [Lachnospiraceae bacterium]
MNNQNRMKYFWLSFTPLLAVLTIQSAVSIFILQLSLVTFIGSSPITDFDVFIRAALSLLTGTSTMSLILFFYGIFALLATGLWYRAFRRQTYPDMQAGNKPTEALTDAKDSLRGYKKGRLIGGILLCGLAFQIVMNYFTTVLAMIRPDWLKTYEDAMKASGVGTEQVSVFIVIYMIIGPLSEELTFRGLTYGYARRAMGFWGANFVQAILFGVFHMNPLQGIMAAVVGLLLGYVYGKTNNIFVTMGIHLTFNATSFLMGDLNFTSLSPFIFFLLILACLIATYVAVRLILSSRPVAVPKEKEPTQN